ncbi:hypothetical protein EPUL_001988 [Erysiphe pulchra]|uniref:SH3 domain-containing protein n=1 Tax=Erysiphe pulchra TaxID=225359 RepID=A0A2S4PTY4_9PEZI|nr:hypothetical protein EPUL_001988 [Erysiphe pulchra]
MPIHNPLPSNMESSFTDPNRALSPDKIIPSSVLANAKGLVILTVLKAGFLGSARYGNGVVVAKLIDGSWSAPSAVGSGGAGFGGQVGIELTDFVFILNDRAAVRTLSQMGSLTLGGNISVAAGPIGRTAEAAGAASFKSVAGIFSYSRTKGFFAGVSVEGSMIVERRDANERLYGVATGPLGHYPKNPRRTQGDYLHTTGYSNRRNKFRDNLSKYRNGFVDEHSSYRTSSSQRSLDDFNSEFDPYAKTNNPHRLVNGYYIKPDNGSILEIAEDYILTDTLEPPEGTEKKQIMKQAILKPMFPNLTKNQAVAIETFIAEQPGDLGFEKGDLITVTQSSGSKNDWWTGMNGKNTGIFPAKYVEMKD